MINISTRLICYLVLFFNFSCSHLKHKEETSVSFTNKEFLVADVKKQMVLDLKKEIERIDGDGLATRTKRPISWDLTLLKLSEEAAKAQSAYQLGRVFKRLNATYPNLHAKVYIAAEYDEKKTEGEVFFPFKIIAESVDQNNTSSIFKVIAEQELQNSLVTGDEILAINNIPLTSWLDENYVFCKFPLRQQCDIEFFDHFKNELLSWNRHEPLMFQIKRVNKLVSISVTPAIKLNPQSNEVKNDNLPCGVSPQRYEGYQLAYEGQHLCAFEATANSKNVAIRIRSFQYENVPFAVLDGEVQLFWNNYWRKKSPYIQNLILDVIDNYGGQSPIPYYGLFYTKPYQEQFVQFKKITEFDNSEILDSLFWGDKGKEIWFENIKKDGSFTKVNMGDFLNPIPQFCSSAEKDCREGLFSPRNNYFNGKVKILMNHWCISSCVGFVYNIKNLLKERVQTFGLPDSGDSTYSRLSILINRETNGRFKTQLAALKKAKNPDNPNSIIRQVIAATRSTDKDGHLLSGQPQTIDIWVTRKWNQTNEDWAKAVFKKAIEKM